MSVLMVTGHRNVQFVKQTEGHCRRVLIDVNPEFVVSGGAEGADTMFAEAAIDLGIPLHLYLPNRFYREYYPRSVSDEIVDAAEQVVTVVDRPKVAGWRDLWSSERWWLDNLVRNKAMVEVATDALIISPSQPKELAAMRSGGTAACVRHISNVWGEREVIWIPDYLDVGPRWTVCL